MFMYRLVRSQQHSKEAGSLDYMIMVGRIRNARMQCTGLMFICVLANDINVAGMNE